MELFHYFTRYLFSLFVIIVIFALVIFTTLKALKLDGFIMPILQFFNPFNLLSKNVGSEFLSGYQLRKTLSPKNKGILLDGVNKRLSIDTSMKHLIWLAKTGVGKSTCGVIPNLLTLEGSFICVDLKAELFQNTAGYLQKHKNYKIHVIDLGNPYRGSRYNPLLKIQSELDLSQLVSAILANNSATNSGGDSAFWESGAKQPIELLLKCMLVQSYREKTTKYLNLANLCHLLMCFGKDGRYLQGYIEQFGNNKVKTEWYSFCSYPEKTLLSFIATSIQSVKLCQNEAIANLLSEDDIDFTKLKEEKTAVYIIVPLQNISYYSFILSMIYTQCFNDLMKDNPNAKYPVYAMLDEAGQYSIPDLESTITFIRSKNVSINLFLQSYSQLETQYSKEKAKTIVEGGITTQIIFPGCSLETTQYVEQLLGRKKFVNMFKKDNTKSTEENLMNSSEVRTMDEVICISGNTPPMKFPVVPFYKRYFFKKCSQVEAPELQERDKKPIPRINLAQYQMEEETQEKESC